MSVKGRLADIRPRDILQIFVAEGKTAAVHLSSDRGFGHIYISDGAVVHAQYRDETGEEALKELLGWTDGEFEVEPGVQAPEHSLDEEAFTSVISERGTRPTRGAEKKGRVDYPGASVGLIKKLIDLNILERIQ